MNIIKETMDSYRLDLCTIPETELRERLIRGYDRIYGLVGDNGFVCHLDEIKELAGEVEDLEDEIREVRDALTDEEDKVEKHEAILAHLQESLGMAVCLASTLDQRTRLHRDYDMVENLVADQMTLDEAIRDIRIQKTEAANV